MDLKNRISEIIYLNKKRWLNFYSRAKKRIERFVYKNIIAIYLIITLFIILFVNVSIRNQKIFELETNINELIFEKEYINTISNTISNTIEE